MDGNSIPANLTSFGLMAMVVMHGLQMVQTMLEKRAARAEKSEDAKVIQEAKNNEAERALIMRLLDQQAATSEGQMKAAVAQAAAMERVGSTLGEIQAHMRDTNQVLAAFQHRLEAVERRLDQSPAATASAILATPTRVAAGRARARES